jgi:hypothetical protein
LSRRRQSGNDVPPPANRIKPLVLKLLKAGAVAGTVAPMLRSEDTKEKSKHVSGSRKLDIKRCAYWSLWKSSGILPI